MKFGISYRLTLASLSVITVLVISSTLMMVSRAFTSLPYYDSWRLYPEAIVDLKTLFQAHNEHVIATIRAFFWLDQKLTSSSGLVTIACILVICAIPATAITLLVRAHGKSLGVEQRGNAILWLGLLSLGYAGVQFSNLVWQFQIGFVSAYALSLAALCCLAASMSVQKKLHASVWLAAALVLAVLASYGLFGGTLVWPAMAVFAWLGRRKVHLSIILVMGAAVSLPYFISILSGPAGHAIGDGKVLKFLLAWLGSPAGGMFDTNYLPVYNVSVRQEVGIAVLFGLLTIAFFAWLSLRVTEMLSMAATDHGVLLLMPLWLFCWIVLVSGLLAAIGRSYLPLNEAISSRYTTPPLIMWACLAGLWVQLRRMKKAAPARFEMAMLLMSAFILASQADRLAQGSLHGARMAQAESAALNDVPDLGALAAVYPTPEAILPRISELREAGVSIFRAGAWPRLGENVSNWAIDHSHCELKISYMPTTYGRTSWHAALTTPIPDHSWQVVYILDQQVAGLGVPENPRGIHLLPSKAHLWIGYSADSAVDRKKGGFALASATQKAVRLCSSELGTM